MISSGSPNLAAMDQHLRGESSLLSKVGRAHRFEFTGPICTIAAESSTQTRTADRRV